MPSALLPVVFLALVLLLAFVYSWNLRRSRYYKLPPGPRPLPIVGNILDIPRTHLGREYADLSARYGDVVYLQVLGQSMIVLGSYEVAQELLNKRAAAYSDRPPWIMSHLCGLSPALTASKQYGSSLRYDRRAFQQAYNPEAIESYRAIHLATTRRFLRAMLTAPNLISSQIQFTLAATIMQIIYGFEPASLHDETYVTVERLTELVTQISVPGQFLVDILPVLRFLPSWLPGAAFKRFAKKAKREFLSDVDLLFKVAVNSNGDAHSESMVADMLRRHNAADVSNGGAGTDTRQMRLKMIKDIGVSAYVASVETTHLVSEAFLMAMAIYPDVQKKAQAEIDAVVGTDRLPEFDDRKALPYVNALIKEVLRWHVPGPIGIPHCTSREDVVNGYFIPQGTIVIPNMWAMARDANKYPDPDNFVPERFLDEEGQLNLDIGDPADIVFGFGRRKCPGQHFAEAGLFIFCASVLHTFHIDPPMGADGVPVKIAHEMTTNRINARPKAYEYVLKPRFPTCAEQLLSG